MILPSNHRYSRTLRTAVRCKTLISIRGKGHEDASAYVERGFGSICNRLQQEPGATLARRTTRACQMNVLVALDQPNTDVIRILHVSKMWRHSRPSSLTIQRCVTGAAAQAGGMARWGWTYQLWEAQLHHCVCSAQNVSGIDVATIVLPGYSRYPFSLKVISRYS